MTDLADIMPITTAFNPNFITFRKTFDRCIEELEIDAGDQEYRKRNQNKNKKIMGFLLLDLKNYINKKMERNYSSNKDYPIYSGGCYKNVYITKENDRFQAPLQYSFKIKNRYDIDHRNYNYSTRETHSVYSNKEKIYIQIKPEDLIKVRVLCKTMNYQLTKTYNFNAIFIKKYNNEGKTSNKGLTAIEYYKYENNEYKNCFTSDRGGWVFGGIKAGDMEYFVKQNGFKFEKNKKYSYGDYANWVLHTLN